VGSSGCPNVQCLGQPFEPNGRLGVGTDLPDDWAQQVHEAFIDVQKWAIPVGAVALPWAWRTGWETLASDYTTAQLFGVDVLFAMVDRPVALIKP
jgi:hypothetical protein